MPLHVDVDATVPASPDLSRSEYTTTATHVSEGRLTCAVSSAAGNTRDTGDGTSGSPGLGGGLVTGFLGDGVRLTAVVGDLGVDEVDDVWPHGSCHDVW